MDTDKPAVPKFASFKRKRDDSTPSQPSQQQPEREVRQKGHDRHPEIERHGTPRSSHTKSHSHHRRHGRQRSRSASTERPPAPAPAPAPALAPREDPLYVFDKRGDPMIVRYGSNERSKTPYYRRFGASRVMGANGRLKFIYDGSRELFSLGNKPGEGPSAFRDRAILSKAARKKTRIFRLRSEPGANETNALEHEPDFLPLSASRQVRHTKDDEHEGSIDDEPNYRSIQGKAKARDFVDSDLESADTSDSEVEANLDHENPNKQSSIELSRQVKEHPEDIEAWLELVDLQDTLLRLDENARQERTDEEAKGLASIRLALLEKALPHATTEADKQKVLLRLMREGARVWSGKVLSKRWEELSLQPNSFALWKAHLDHELCNMTTFTFSRLKQMHVAQLQRLQQDLTETVQATIRAHAGRSLQEVCDTRSDALESLISICDEMTYVFLRLTSFIRDAGYTELAVAAWQALLELTFARPSDDTDPDNAELMSSFRDFWESEVPRIGEDGAQGWCHFTEAEDMADLPEAKTEAAPAVPDTKDVYKAWASVETQRSRNAAMPARTLDEGTEEDPFRVVVFADLEPLLFHIPSPIATTSRVKAAILHSFLLFCQLPAPPIETGNTISAARLDPFTYCDSARIAQPNPGRSDGTEDDSRKPPRFSSPGHRFAGSVEVIYSDSNWFRHFDHAASPEADLALTATTQLATIFEYGPIAEYSLGLSWNKRPATIKKAAKALLKKWPNDSRLYHAYAVAEWRNGHLDVARNVLMSATSQDLRDKERLYTTWAWLELESGDMKGALARCISASKAGAPADPELSATSSQFLKARQTLSASCDFLLSTGDLHQATLFAETLALLEYVSQVAGTTELISRQGDIQASMDVIHKFTVEAVSRGHGSSMPLEKLLQMAAHLLYLHATRGPFRPTYLREQLHKFIVLFPTNTMFLTLFTWADTSLLLKDPVRDLLRTQVLTKSNDCLTSRLFAIQHEMHSFGSIHSVRTAFERALDSDVCRGNVGLWLSYVRFCARNRKGLRGKAKEVYYRALGACPWSKELAMEAFNTLLREMESSELRSVWNTMTMKGLRMCVDLDEFSGEWAKRPRRQG
ncbi:hypothetical protein N0V93_004965 [Gnomoniopsis smithogilvyi]|uniref:DUF1740-domain-containing protein n=1 Tax=Gnomoniopsis smithogilvyi TaxID=1191159 RepID=A0A9W8YTF4_9PEZI|nr:hypothetical protein N0V93_004965 [Gnomoniopsis smithogilvyi]